MITILVTGSNRGIGFELVKKLASHPDPADVIIATCRDPSKAQALVSLSQQYPVVKILKLDVEKVEEFPEFVSQVSAIVGEHGLNILVNNAGVAFRTLKLEEIKYDEYLKVLKTNIVAPVFLTQALLPLLKKSAAKKPESAKGIRQTAILNMSSKLGCVSEKQIPVWGYNESKAALNQATRSMSSNLNEYGILAVTLHPGWVKTDMGGSDADITVEESVSGLINIIYNLSKESDDKFFRYDGSFMPW